MRVLVCGSRKGMDFNRFVYELDGLPIDHLIAGGAKGIDSMAEFHAKVTNIPYTIYPAKWENYGKAAGPIRNKQMLEEGKPDIVIAFLAKDSKGTKDMVEQATKANIPVRIINI